MSNNWIWAGGFLALVMGGIGFGAKAGVESGREALRLETLAAKKSPHTDEAHHDAPTKHAREGAQHEDQGTKKLAKARAEKAPARLELVKGTRAGRLPSTPSPRLEIKRARPARPSGRLFTPASHLDIAFATGRIDNLPGRPALDVIVPPKPVADPAAAPIAVAPEAPEAPEPPAAPELKAPAAPEAPEPPAAPEVKAPEAPEAPKAPAAEVVPAPEAPEAPEPPEAPVVKAPEAPEAPSEAEAPAPAPTDALDAVEAPEAAPSEEVQAAPAPEAEETDVEAAPVAAPEVEKSTEAPAAAPPSPTTALEGDEVWVDETESDHHIPAPSMGSVTALEFANARM